MKKIKKAARSIKTIDAFIIVIVLITSGGVVAMVDVYKLKVMFWVLLGAMICYRIQHFIESKN
jgi:hypothetical protein